MNILDRIRRRLADQVGRRHLRERDKSREAGDSLAGSVYDYINDPHPTPEDRERLAEALLGYCQTEGWGGPAMKFIIKEGEKRGTVRVKHIP